MADVLVQGILMGGVYGLIALGFVIVYKATGVINLAYGEFIMLLSYLLWYFLSPTGLPLWLSLLLLFVVGAGAGFLLERGFIRPLIGQSFLALIMITLMLGLVFRGVTVMFWGVDSVSYSFAPVNIIKIGRKST